MDAVGEWVAWCEAIVDAHDEEPVLRRELPVDHVVDLWVADRESLRKDQYAQQWFAEALRDIWKGIRMNGRGKRG